MGGQKGRTGGYEDAFRDGERIPYFDHGDGFAGVHVHKILSKYTFKIFLEPNVSDTSTKLFEIKNNNKWLKNNKHQAGHTQGALGCEFSNSDVHVETYFQGSARDPKFHTKMQQAALPLSWTSFKESKRRGQSSFEWPSLGSSV